MTSRAMHRHSILRDIVLGALVVFLLSSAALLADGGVVFHDIAADDGAGITYRRASSPSAAIFDELKAQSLLDEDQDGVPDDPYRGMDVPLTPIKSRGAPGVALLDFDDDGDLDIYVTNGPGRSNSLYENQLIESGLVTFIDVAATAGVGASDQDSTGTCFGDIDNDGDSDLLVLGNNEPNRLFENLGSGAGGIIRFEDISLSAGIGGGNRSRTGCSMGDVDADGLLDIVVANAYTDFTHQLAIFDPFPFNEHNQLFLNLGGNTFADVSASSGIEDLDGFPPQAGPAASLTWAIAMVDIDLDGDVDILHANDQGAVVFEKYGGVDRGFIHLMTNDGSGVFTDTSVGAGTDRVGQWMGLSFGDLDCDGHMDLFGSNLGDWMVLNLPLPYTLGDSSSRWLLGQADGTFTDPGVGAVVATPFGWGTSMADYDNDGDTDILFHGGLDVGPFLEASNPGVILQNQGCSAEFVRDTSALASSTNHSRRNVQGVATGDLDNDGFVDIVSVSNFDVPEAVALVPFSTAHPAAAYGSPFDDEAFFVESFVAVGPGVFVWSEIEIADGTLSVELSSAENGHHWVAVEVMGSVGLTSGGVVNRDGIGAVVTFTPHNGATSMDPIVGGSSYASQDSLTAHFGLGFANHGVAEVLWPGGARNRLYQVLRFEKVLFPEIPCSYSGEWADIVEYTSCLDEALDDLVSAGVLDHVRRVRFKTSAIRAFVEHRSAPQTPGLLSGIVAGGASADGGITFTNVAENGGAGIDFAHTPAGHFHLWDAIRQASLSEPLVPMGNAGFPHRMYGIAGVAILDYDRDGDLDIYVTNGPGSTNSLFENQLVPSGVLVFADVGEDAGVGAADHDSLGTCYGDTDNDGDPDLLVLGRSEPNRFFVNNGRGTDGRVTFTEDVGSGLGGGSFSSSSCTMGDVDGDGLLDVHVGNAFDFETSAALQQPSRQTSACRWLGRMPRPARASSLVALDGGDAARPQVPAGRRAGRMPALPAAVPAGR